MFETSLDFWSRILYKFSLFMNFCKFTVHQWVQLLFRKRNYKINFDIKIVGLGVHWQFWGLKQYSTKYHFQKSFSSSFSPNFLTFFYIGTKNALLMVLIIYQAIIGFSFINSIQVPFNIGMINLKSGMIKFENWHDT